MIGELFVYKESPFAKFCLGLSEILETKIKISLIESEKAFLKSGL